MWLVCPVCRTNTCSFLNGLEGQLEGNKMTWKADRKICLNAAKEVCECDSAEAATVLVDAGQEIAMSVAIKHGLAKAPAEETEAGATADVAARKKGLSLRKTKTGGSGKAAKGETKADKAATSESHTAESRTASSQKGLITSK